MSLPLTYLIYLVVSVLITVWVGHTLHSRGRIFLVNTFHGNEKLADAVNDLLIVGFYLVNIAFVAIALRYGTKPLNLAESIEFLAMKVGIVMVVLAFMHFGNLLVFTAITKGKRSNRIKPINEVGGLSEIG